MNNSENGNIPDRSVELLLKGAGILTRHCKIIPLQGGNNRVYKLITDNDQYILKKYFSSEEENRNRLSAEYIFLEYIWEAGVRNVPKPVFSDSVNHMALYQYIEGVRPGKDVIQKTHIIKAMDFIETINIRKGINTKLALQINNASDFCPSIQEYLNSVDKRTQKLSFIDPDGDINQEAKKFIAKRLVPEWGKTRANVKNLKGEDIALSKSDLILSPSDFGFHNAIIKNKSEIFFIDFEYAGWDDPIKMICDFFCQPEIPVRLNYFEYCIERMIRIICPTYDFLLKAKLLLPLFRIKWCCIMLNVFLNADSKRKQYAFFNEDRREKQLMKTLEYFNRYF